MDLDRLRDDLWALRRDPDDRLLGGVCSAVAARLGVDVLLVRTAAVVLALGAGIGAVAYAWAWLVLPPRGSDDLLLARWLPGAATWDRGTHERVGAATVLAALVLLPLVLPWSLGPATVVVALVVLGNHFRHRASTGDVPAVPAGSGHALGPGASRAAAVVAARRAPRRHPRHGVARAAAAVVALTVGSLVVLGLVPRTTGAHGIDGELSLASPAAVDAVPRRVAGSRITYDLSALRPAGAQRVELAPTASSITVVVPDDVPVRVEYHLVASVLDVEPADGEGAHLAGFAHSTWPDTPAPSSGPLVVLSVDARASAVLVRHA